MAKKCVTKVRKSTTDKGKKGSTWQGCYDDKGKKKKKKKTAVELPKLKQRPGKAPKLQEQASPFDVDATWAEKLQHRAPGVPRIDVTSKSAVGGHGALHGTLGGGIGYGQAAGRNVPMPPGANFGYFPGHLGQSQQPAYKSKVTKMKMPRAAPGAIAAQPRAAHGGLRQVPEKPLWGTAGRQEQRRRGVLG